jgi:hypothetical protein
MKMSVHVKMIIICMAVYMMSRSSHKIVHHFSMYIIVVIIISLVYTR